MKKEFVIGAVAALITLLLLTRTKMDLYEGLFLASCVGCAAAMLTNAILLTNGKHKK
jgi:hypothetical protein